MGEQWGLSVKLFGKTILVVPTSEGADAHAQVCSDELLKDAELTSPVTEEEIAGGRESQSHEPETQTGKGGGEEKTEDEDAEELRRLPQQEEKQRDDERLPQPEEKQRDDDEEEIQKKEAAVTEAASTNEENEENEDEKKKMTTVGDKKKPDKNKILPCPRCKSEDTKFCYYNNYNVNQPRHFCRNCQRYWTAGGTMRNVPVGAGRRKSKSAVAALDTNNSLYVFMLRHHQQQLQNGYITGETAALHQPSMHTNKASTVLSFSPDTPVDCVTPIGHVNSPTQTVPGVVLVYSPASASASTPTSTRTAAVAKNQFFPSYFNNFTNDQRRGGQQHYYNNQSTMNVTNPLPSPICSSKYEPGIPPPTPPAEMVHVWQQPMHLGKHMRDGETNAKGDVKQRRHEEGDDRGNRNIWVPKALRITDTPDAAASSSIWTTISASGLGFNKKDQNHCGKSAPSAAMERGFFNAFPTKERQVATLTTRENDNRDAVLSANPAAVARSLKFQETV